MSITFLRQLIVAIGLFTDKSALAQPNCVHPDVDKFLDQSQAITGIYGGFPPELPVIFLTFKLGSSYFQWMAASWEAPPEGTLFVLNCSGRSVAALRIGEFGQLKAGPVIPGFGKTIEVAYTLIDGTGWLTKDVTLIAFPENRSSCYGITKHPICFPTRRRSGRLIT